MTNTFVNSISRDIYRSARTGYRRAVADHHRAAEQRFDLLDEQGFRFCNAAAAYLSIVRVFCERTFFFFLEKRAFFSHPEDVICARGVFFKINNFNKTNN